MTWLRAYWKNAALALIALALLQASYQKGLDAGMASGKIEPSWRYHIYAAPIVLSQLYYGRPYDYVGYHKLAQAFQGPTPSIDALAGPLKAIPNVESEGLFFILADDKGTVDITRLAFGLYGIGNASLYYFYFTILFVSSALFVFGYFRDRHKLAMLALLCLGVFATMPGFLGFPVNVLDTHATALLSLIAAFHVLLSATEANPTRPALLVTTVAQALIMTLVYHVRSSTVTQTIAIAAAYPIILYVTRAGAPSYRRRFVPLVILLAALALLPVYQRLQYHPDYFGRRATLSHVVYHNLLIGLQWNPALAARYGLGDVGTDLGAARAVEAFYDASGHSELRTWSATGINAVTTQMPFDFVAYEEAARALYLKIWREEPMEVLLAVFYWHPRDIYNVVRLYAGFTFHPRFDLQHAYNPFRPVYLGVLLLTVALCSGGGTPLRPGYALMALIMLASSLLVPLAFYAGGFVILAEFFVMTSLVTYATMAVLLSHAFARWRQRFAQREAVVEGASA